MDLNELDRILVFDRDGNYINDLYEPEVEERSKTLLNVEGRPRMVYRHRDKVLLGTTDEVVSAQFLEEERTEDGHFRQHYKAQKNTKEHPNKELYEGETQREQEKGDLA